MASLLHRTAWRADCARGLLWQLPHLCRCSPGAPLRLRPAAAAAGSHLQQRYLHWSQRSGSFSSDASSKPYCITTPIYYVNAEPHIGHLHSGVVADVLARWHQWRWKGQPRPHLPAAHGDGIAASEEGQNSVVFATGTDEHGLKVQKVAEQLGEDPQKLCDRISLRFKDLSDTAGLGYTRFIRTTEEPHKAAVQHLWRQLDARGHIYKGSHAGWYAVSDEAFYPEGQLRDVKDAKTGEQYKVSIESGQRVEWAEEENYKFKLSAMQKPLLDWLHSDPAPVQPRKYWEQVVTEVEAGLQDLSISRPASRLYWGIQVPDDTSHSIYVWIDALTNYLTVTGYPEGAAEAWPADVHVVGKDILRFHAIYWPAMLLAAGLPPPRCILSHGHWTMDRAKMSKSRGNVVNPFEAIEQYGLDTLRFFLMRVGGSFSTDSDFSHSTLVECHRKHLQGQLGNLLSRVLAPKILARLGTSEGSVEIARPEPDPRTEELQRSLEALPQRFDGLMADFELSKALEAVFESIARANELTSEIEPWSSSTSTEDIARAVYHAVETLRISALLLQPFIPGKASELLQNLGVELGSYESSSLVPRDVIRLPYSQKKIKPLFPPVSESTKP